MTTPTSICCLSLAAALLLTVATSAAAQNIYKCTHGGQVSYTDHPCPRGRGELLHQADDTDVIDQYLRLGQDRQARAYAQARHLDALYEQRVRIHEQALQVRAQRQADEAFAAQERDAQARQQALADAVASQDRLRAENDALRTQNNQYQNQRAPPVYNQAPTYWNAVPPYWRPPHHGPDRPRPKEPVFHPCKQLAGGRVQC
ncbi:MAG: DUF4124 domain-containing protein [Rhodanobacter sp.]